MVLPTSPDYTRVTIRTARGSRRLYDGGRRTFQPQDSVKFLLAPELLLPPLPSARHSCLHHNSSWQMALTLQPDRIRIASTSDRGVNGQLGVIPAVQGRVERAISQGAARHLPHLTAEENFSTSSGEFFKLPQGAWFSTFPS